MTHEENRVTDPIATTTTAAERSVTATLIPSPPLTERRRRAAATTYLLAKALVLAFPSLVLVTAVAFTVRPTPAGADLINRVAGSGEPVEVLGALGWLFGALCIAAAVLAFVTHSSTSVAAAVPTLWVATIWVLLSSPAWALAVCALGLIGVVAKYASTALNGGQPYGSTGVLLERTFTGKAVLTPAADGHPQHDETLTDRIAQAHDGHLRGMPTEGTSHVRR